jgi:hypothetical protein
MIWGAVHRSSHSMYTVARAEHAVFSRTDEKSKSTRAWLARGRKLIFTGLAVHKAEL